MISDIRTKIYLFRTQFGVFCAVLLILAAGAAVVIASYFSPHYVRPISHMPLPKPVTDAEMLDAMKHAPIGALLSCLLTFYIMCLALSLFFAPPIGRPFVLRFLRYLVVSCGFAAALQAVFLYGLGIKIFAAMWSHILNDASNMRQSFAAYMLAAIVVVGAAEITVTLALLPRSIHRLIQKIKKLPVPFQNPSRGGYQ